MVDLLSALHQGEKAEYQGSEGRRFTAAQGPESGTGEEGRTVEEDQGSWVTVKRGRSWRHGLRSVPRVVQTGDENPMTVDS